MGAKSTSKTEIPAYIEQAGQESLNRAKQLSAMGYVPFMGPEVATYDPTAAMSANQAFSAFGMPTLNTNPMAGMPTATAGGVTGYSSAPLLFDAQNALKQKYPGLYEYLTSMFIDPVTGRLPDYMQPESPAVTAATAAGPVGRESNYSVGNNYGSSATRVSGPSVSSRAPASRGAPTRSIGGILSRV